MWYNHHTVASTGGKMHERVPAWAFFSMGLSIAAVQGLLIRLLLVSFSGNELSIGLLLGNWMVAEALGSHLTGRLASRLSNTYLSFVFLQAGFAVLLPFIVAGCYLVRLLAGVAPGETLDLVSIVRTSLLLLAPLSALHGAMFSLGAATYQESAGDDRAIVARLYAYEALGAMCGGVALTFLLVPYFKPTQIALLLVIVGLATTALLLWSRPPLRRRLHWRAAVGLTAVLFLFLLLSPQALVAHRSLTRLRWGGVYNVLYERDSPYGNIAVTQRLGQYTFLANGVPILTTPVPDVATVEETVHLPLLFHAHPQHVLVIGGGLGGIAAELLKYPLDSVDYAELDPVLIQAVRAFPTELTRQELQDRRLLVHSVDGRLHLNQMARQPVTVPPYDSVLVNLPYPSTLELNRFYTQDFFHLVRQVLNEDGLAVFTLPGSLTYIGPAMRDLNLMLKSGLQTAFPHVRPIPGDTTFWLASPSLTLESTTTEALIATWQQRALPTSFITPSHLRVRFDPQRLSWFERSLQIGPAVIPNRDLRPAGVLYGLSYWSEMLAPATHRILTAIRRVTLWQWCLSAAALATGLWLWRRARPGGSNVVIPIVVATTGFAGMVCDLTVVFVFQILYGYVYQHIGLIIAAFMGGLAIGGWTAMRPPMARLPGHRTLAGCETALIGFWAVLPLLLNGLASAGRALLAIPVLLLLNALGGWLVGLQFTLSSQLHLAAQGEVSQSAGLLYAADLLGAFLGAIAVGIALLPALGVAGTCIFIVVLKTCSLALFLTASGSQAPQSPGMG